MAATAVLVVVCGVGLGVAVWMIVTWGRTPRNRRPLLVESAEPLVLAASTVRSVVTGMVGGIIAGVLVAGLGGRLMMRVLAATSGDSAQGLATEANETVGEITLSGSIGFVVLNGLFFGMIGGVGYVLLRRWLPSPPWLAGLTFGVALLAFAPLDALDPDNSDFAILSPSWLAVALVVCLFPFFGMTAASVIERLDRSWPAIGKRPIAVLAYSPLLLAIPVSPVALGTIVAVGAVVALHGRRAFVDFWHGRGVTIAGQIVIGALLVLAAYSAGSSGLEILRD